ncbi:MAG: DUF2244 domain-containing protein [Armatimonadetes bacterium]|nr:DUF2244 domain-containing protein [Armatimonadota bacterium]
MAQLEEIPGALERPGGCRIEVIESDEGEYTVVIPPRGLPPLLIAGAVLLTLNLLVVLVTGLMLLLAHRSVLFMAQISPHDLPVSMHPLRAWLFLVLLGIEAVGGWLLLLIVRPSVTRERIVIGRGEVRHTQETLGRTRLAVIPRQNVQAFHLRRDPHGLVSGVLTLRARGESVVVAEFVPEADREWLASVGNALLRR